MDAPLSEHIAPLYVDVEHNVVWQGETRLRLTPKACAVLQYLMARQDHVVDKGLLLDTFWPDPAEATEAALTTCIREIRQKLQDRATAPSYIETVYPRRQTYPGAPATDGGYRFIGPVVLARSDAPRGVPAPGRLEPWSLSPRPPSHLFGRESELTQLYHSVQQAWDGQRQVLLVTGEPGLGKTTLVNALLEGLSGEPALWIVRGQCIALYGEGEAYLPILEAFGRLGREGDADQLRSILDRYAPTWLAQMPFLLEPDALVALQRRVQGTTPQRMLREMAEALEMLTTHRTLLVVLEDLQWSDISTLHLMAWLALRAGRARLCILGTLRPVEAGHPLAQIVYELCRKGACRELSLPPLREEAVAAYLATRVPDGVARVPPRLGQVVAQRTEGNPLFMVHVVNYLDAHGWGQGGGIPPVEEVLTALVSEVPQDIARLIETQVASLPLADQRLLEVASLAGITFSTAAVAAGGELTLEEVEERCAALARRGPFLRESGMDHTPAPLVTTRYRFVHALYQDVLARRVPARRRVTLHQRLGAWEEQECEGETAARAAELAVRFTQAHEVRRAVGYRRQAAEVAIQRSAYHEALTHITHGLTLLKELPEGPERRYAELSFYASLGPVLMATQGYAAPAVHEVYAQAQALCHQCPDSPYLFAVLFGVWGFHLVRTEYRSAQAHASQLLHVAQRGLEPGQLVEAQGALGITAFYLGNLVASRAYFAQSVGASEGGAHRGRAPLSSQDPWIAARAWEGQVLWLLGYPEQALQAGSEALTAAEELAHPFSTVFALFNLGMIHHFRGESTACYAQAARQVRVSEEQGFPFWVGSGLMLMGWAMAHQGQAAQGVQHLRDGLALRQAMGTASSWPYAAALLAEGYGRLGQGQEGLAMLTAALEAVATTGEQWCEAELYRCQGVLRLAHGQDPQEGEACIQQARAVACQQQAKSLELRAALSLSRLWQQQGKHAEASALLAPLYDWFTEGFDTADLREAKALLEARGA